jgi:putative N-acetylmannosamine-6-phosphate epimerase
MEKLLFIFSFAVISLMTLSQDVADAQNSGERYLACTSTGCAIIGNTLCGYANVLNEDGTVDTFWCVIIEVVRKPIESV